MSKKNKFILVSLISLLVVLVVGGVGSILAGKSGEAINNVDTGVVNIRIDEFMLNENDEEVPWVDSAQILPGMIVSKIPYFTATGNDCYIRATVDIEESIDSGNPITMDDLEGISEDWVRVGDYFYYTKPLETNDKVDFFHGVRIPNWGNDLNPKNVGDWEIDLIVTVDAVQSENFTPDFNSDSPWHNVEIQESIHKDGYDMATFTENVETVMSVTIVDEDNIVVEPEDFFSGFKTMVPGDTLADSVKINVDRDSEVFFNAESLTDIELLDKMELQLVLHKDGKDSILYDGKLNADIKEMSLGKYKKGESATLNFVVYMPEELDNQYTLRNASVKWTFGCVPIDEISTGIDNTMSLIALIGAGLCIIAAIIVAILKKRKNNKVDGDEKVEV